MKLLVYYCALWVSLCLFLIGFGIYSVWDSSVNLPNKYAQLRANGVHATAHVVKCAAGIGGGRGVGCRLSLRYGGATRTWDYPLNAPQFKPLARGAPVPVLVDPRDPTTVYTVHDVTGNIESGTGYSLIWLIFIVPGIAGLLGFTWFAFKIAPNLRRQSDGGR
jgi:hypothetical protein